MLINIQYIDLENQELCSSIFNGISNENIYNSNHFTDLTIYIYIYIAIVLKFLFQYKTIIDAIIDFETLDLTLQIPNLQLRI